MGTVGGVKALILLLVVVCAGCASTYDWSSEIGTYTLDAAKIEFGPPDSTSKLEDGGTVASWIVNRRTVKARKRILRFDKNGKLVSGKTESRRR